MPKDLLDYFQSRMGGDLNPQLPKRKRVEEEKKGGPIVTSTPEAIWWLFSRHENGVPVGKFDPSKILKPDIYWEPWSRPKHGLAIDNCIEDLIIASDEFKEHAGKRAPRQKRGGDARVKYEVRKIISRDEFANIAHKNGEHDQHECPYVYVRERLAYAVGLAYDDENIDLERRSSIPQNIDRVLEEIKSAKLSIERAISGIDKFDTLHLPEKYARSRMLGPTLQGAAARRQEKADLSSALAVISESESRFSSLRKEVSRSGRREDVWWVSFVMSCGAIWTTLTGVPPNQGHSGFEDFLRAANKSLGGKREQFLSQINTALTYLAGDGDRQGLNPWDQLDAEINGTLSPEDNAVRIYTGDDLRHINNRLEISVLKYIEKIKSGDHSAVRSIQMHYVRTGDSGKKLIQDLLDRHGLLGAFQGTPRVNH